MPYSKNSRFGREKEIRKAVSQKMPEVKNATPDQLKSMIINEVNNNKNLHIDDAVKEKINNGDIEGLRNDLVNYLNNNPSLGSTGKKLLGALKNNDMGEIMGQLTNMFSGRSQKKNEIDPPSEKGDESNSSFDLKELIGLFDPKELIGLFASKAHDFNRKDERVIFLNAIKPFLCHSRGLCIDECVKFLSVYSIVQKLQAK
jgi:hypothetical protein